MGRPIKMQSTLPFGPSVTPMSFNWNNLLLQEELPRTGSNAMDPNNHSVLAVFNASHTEGLTFLHPVVHTLPQ